MKCLYRVNCGNTGKAYKDQTGNEWQPDQELSDGREWGAIGGNTVVREKALPIHGVPRPEVYRSERYGMKAYEFHLPDATYHVRLHFAETFESNYRAGLRLFDVSLNGLRMLHEFDPFAAAGGFAKGVVREFSDVGAPNGKLTIGFSDGAIVNGIEIYAANKKPAPRRELKRILFIGNSHVIFWNLAGTLEFFINQHPNPIHLETHRALAGGKDMVYHYDHTDVLKRIDAGRFDYVVLQSMRADDAEQKARLLEYSAKYCDAIRKSGGTPVLYCTWPKSDDPFTDFDAIATANHEVARKLGMIFVPAGPAWKKSLLARPKLRLHNCADNGHAGLHGGYLTACVFYGILTGKKPQGNVPAAGRCGHVALDPKMAAYLQKIAGETLGEYAK
jgi:hypothetical protein